MTEAMEPTTEAHIVYSIDGERFDDYEYIIDEINNNNPPGSKVQIYKGVSCHPKHSDFFNFDDLVERMQEQAWEEHSEFAEDYLCSKGDEKIDELHAIIDDWLDSNLAAPNFYKVINIEKITVTVQAADNE